MARPGIELCGLLVRDRNKLARPGVLVVHGRAGLDAHAKGRGRQLAELGPFVFAPSLVERFTKLFRIDTRKETDADRGG